MRHERKLSDQTEEDDHDKDIHTDFNNNLGFVSEALAEEP